MSDKSVLHPLNPTAIPDNPPVPFAIRMAGQGWHTFWAIDCRTAIWQANLTYDEPEILKIVALNLDEAIMPSDIRQKYYEDDHETK